MPTDTPNTSPQATYLTVPFAQKDQAKRLGARWDGARRQWFVPAGMALEAFASWLPASLPSLMPETLPALPTVLAEPPASPYGVMPLSPPVAANLMVSEPSSDLSLAPGETPRLSLSQLLNQVSRLVQAQFQTPRWVMAEVVQARAPQGHVYLELSERAGDGRVLAKANAVIWARTAQKIMPAFERATGMTLGPGIKLLLSLRPVLHAQYGFSLEVDDLDPDYTLGDLEAKKREIRARLQQEGVLGANRALPAPWDFYRVLVIAPEQAAGLGDFQAEAHRLAAHGVCQFEYLSCRFQGEGAAVGIAQTLQAWLARLSSQALSYDAVVIVRGGGAVNDLAWLNDYALARTICDCPIPVFTGIGHERDHTVLDDVAHTRFDTPSKVIAGIEQTIVRRAGQAQQVWRDLTQTLQNQLAALRLRVQNLQTGQQQAALRLLSSARRQVHSSMLEQQRAAQRCVRQARQTQQALMQSLQQQIAYQRHEARTRPQQHLREVLHAAQLQAHARAQELARWRQQLVDEAQRQLMQARQHSDAWLREVIGQGPQKTLLRGFAWVHGPGAAAPAGPISGETPPTETTISRAAQLAPGEQVTIEFADGAVLATVKGTAPASTRMSVAQEATRHTPTETSHHAPFPTTPAQSPQP